MIKTDNMFECGEVIDETAFKNYIKLPLIHTHQLRYKKCGYVFNFIDDKMLVNQGNIHPEKD